jgi:predicted outer membrane protein
MVTASRPVRWKALIVTGLAAPLLGGFLVTPAAAGTTTNGHPAAGRLAGAPAVPVAAPPVVANQPLVLSLAAEPVATPTALPPAESAGPLGPADRDLLINVRLAGLWEMPAGKMAAEKGSTERVREVGAELAAQHADLDALTVRAANALNVPLPTEANSDQKFWLQEMELASGRDFDQVFVDRLRAAHGKIFPVIGSVRAGTRNSIVREVAISANKFVANHLAVLESTGVVDYSSLPLPSAPGAVPGLPLLNSSPVAGAVAQGNVGGVNPIIIWAVLAVALAAGGYSVLRLMRPR